MNLQEQLAAIRREKQAQFETHRAQSDGADGVDITAAPSTSRPTPSAPLSTEARSPVLNNIATLNAPSTSSSGPTVPQAPAVSSGLTASAQSSAPDASSELQAPKRPMPAFDAREAMQRLGPDATIGDLLADAPLKKPKKAPVSVAKPLGLETENAQTILEVKQAPPGTLRLLSWNIDGIDENSSDVVARTAQVCIELIDSAVSVVFLQEVIGPTLQVIQRLLGPLYHIVVPPNPMVPYFCIMLLQKERVKVTSPVTISRFETSMGRELLSVNVTIDGHPVYLSTAHLESTKNFAAERKKQFEVAINKLAKAPDGLAIFGGDMNLRDDEAKRLMKETASICSYADAWESAGQPAAARFTWDLQKNDNCQLSGSTFKPRCRFDRVYYRGHYECTKFALLGTQRIPECGRFPSDHFGVLIEWTLTQQATPVAGAPSVAEKKRKTAAVAPKRRIADSSVVIDIDDD